MTGNIAIFVPHVGCPNMCSFCNQRSISGETEAPTAEDVKNICEDALKNMPDGYSNVEIAFFGGSFTAIKREYMLELLNAAQPYLKDSRIKGIRVSTRPDAIDDEILSILKMFGVTAIELGAQSMDDRVLMMNRRGHTVEDVVKASKLIKDYGFSLGLQMMTGLYGSDFADDYNTALEICKLKPDTVRIYPTVVIKNTQLGDLFTSGEYKAPTAEESVPLCTKLIDLFNENNIKIIRLGLHASRSLERDILGGAYSPAMGEMCLAERFYNEMTEDLKKISSKNIILKINPRIQSQVMGQKKRNLKRLSDLGYKVTVEKDESVTDYSIIEER